MDRGTFNNLPILRMPNILLSNLFISTSLVSAEKVSHQRFHPTLISECEQCAGCDFAQVGERQPPISGTQKSSRWTNICVYWDWAEFSVKTSQ